MGRGVGGSMNVEDVMTPRKEVVTVEIPGTRDDVLEYLQDRAFSSVPAVKQTDGGEVYRGIISRSALIEQPNEDQLAMLTEDVPTTSRGTTLTEVAEHMASEGARRVPVVDGDALKGIITITDVVMAVARVVEGEEDTGESIANQDDEWAWEGIKAVGSRYMPTRNVEIPNGPVREFMTPDLVTISGSRPATEAAQLMIEHDIEQLPVVSGGDLDGIVQDMDLLEALR